MVAFWHQERECNLEGYPLSASQMRMWFLDKTALDKALYHNPSAICITGLLNIDRLKAACDSLLKVHGQLRLLIREVNGEPFQFVLPFSPSTLNCIEANTGTVDQIIYECVRKAFSLEDGIVCRFDLISLGSHVHIFILNVHHIVCDGWSKSILLRDLLSFYQGIEIIPSHHTYFDFVQEGDAKEFHEDWKALFPETITSLQLPIDREYPNISSGKGALFSFQIGEEFSQRVRDCARQHSATLFTFFLSLFSIALARWGDQESFGVGCPVSGRVLEKWKNIVGLFVNTVLFHVNLNFEESYAIYIESFKQQVSSILSRQDIPFEKVVEFLNPPRELGRHPLYQVMFQYDNFPLPSLEIGDLVISPYVIDFGIAQLDVSMTIWPQGKELHGSIEYRTDILDCKTIERFYGYFIMLIQGVMEDPWKKIGDLPFFSKEEQRLWEVMNATESTLPYIHVLSQIEQIAKRYPHAIAVFAEKELTYGDLIDQAYRCAAGLIEKGIGYQDRLAIHLPKSREIVIAIIAAIISGALFTVIDPDVPLPQKNVIFEIFKPKWILDEVILTEKKPEGTFFMPLNFSDDSQEGEDEACVIFTSGSTGSPKGVILRHSALANVTNAFISSYGVTPSDRLLSFSSVAFASFLGEILPMLCSGGSVVFPIKEAILDLGKLDAFINANSITLMSTVPSFIRHLNKLRFQPQGVRFLLSGGEALHWKDIEHFQPPLSVVNSYGLTEATICSSYETIGRSSSQKEMTLGQPLPNTELFVLTKGGRIAPIGCAGEIAIGGLGLMKGYLDDEVMTQSSFQRHPLKEETKVLLTKDRGFFSSEGKVVFLGRRDTQIKVRGYRVNTLEVERVILQHPLIKYAATSIDEGRLIAVVEGERSIALSLRKWLLNHIPEYMVPLEIIAVDTIAFNQNGKLDLVAIRNSISGQTYINDQNNGAFTDVERAIEAIWKRVLKNSSIDINGNFFDQGGNSILLMKLFHLIKTTVTSHLEIMDLLRFPTIRLQAKYIEDKGVETKVEQEIRQRAKLQQKALRKHR